MNKTKRILVFLILFVSSLIFVARANAEVVVGNQIEIYVGEGNQTDQAAAYDSINKRYLAVWYEGFGDTGNFYGKLVNIDGSLFGERITIYQAGNNPNLSSPRIAFDSVNQRYLVAWSWWHEIEGVWVRDVYGQFINTDGSLSGEDFRISPDPFEIGIYQLTAQDIIFDTIQNRFLVLISSISGGSPQLYGQFVNTNGPSGGFFQITDVPSGLWPWNGRIGFDSSNDRFIVTYDNFDYGNSYGCLLNYDGTLYKEEFIISTGSPWSNTNIVSLPFDPFNNRFLAVFNRTGHEVQGQLIDAEGDLFGEVIRIFGSSDSNSAIFDTVNNKFLVVEAYGGMRGQLLNPDGSLFGSDFFIPTSNPYPPVLIGDLSIGALIVWSDDLGYGTGREIVGRLLQYVNNLPVLNPIGNKKAIEGKLLNFQVSGYDPDTDTVQLSARNLPSGASFVDYGSGMGVFSWAPDYSQVGSYFVTFQISDGKLSDEEVINILVTKKRTTTELIEKYQRKIETPQEIKFFPSDKLRRK